MIGMTKIITLDDIREYEKDKIADYIIKSAKAGKRKVICLRGENIEEQIWRIKVRAGLNGVSFSEMDEPTDFDAEPEKKIYIYYTSKLDKKYDKWISENHPGVALVIEDLREFSGECKKIEIN